MKRVWVTRDEEADGPLCCALRACGLEPVLEPVLKRVVVGDVSGELRGLGAEDWLVLTSVYAIENVPVELARVPRVAVVGEASQAAAQARGFRVELVSEKGTGHSLFAELQVLAKERRVVYPRSTLAKIPTDVAAFREFRAPILYETVREKFEVAVVDEVQMIALTSASAVRALDAKLRLTELSAPLASIGVTTSAAVEACGGEVAVQPKRPTLVGLAHAIAAALLP